MKTKMFSVTNVSFFGLAVTMIVLSGCSTSSLIDKAISGQQMTDRYKFKLVTKVMDTTIPSGDHALLFLDGGATLIHRFNGSSSLISTATQGDVLVIPPGSHNFYVMLKMMVGYNQYAETPHPGKYIEQDFSPGQLYFISGFMQQNTITFFIQTYEERIAGLDEAINHLQGPSGTISKGMTNEQVLAITQAEKTALMDFKVKVDAEVSKL
ncbi:MAG: hypothetical protein FWD36_08490 [Treponema sp.]|nr:hypothetical protein [Treponema sp.]